MRKTPNAMPNPKDTKGSSGSGAASEADRELLELAAKAAGIPRYLLGAFPGEGDDEWNPLNDDGMALRLAVALRLQVITSGTNIVQAIDYATTAYGEAPVWSDRCAATRRAIVRAAAEIGKTQPTPSEAAAK